MRKLRLRVDGEESILELDGQRLENPSYRIAGAIEGAGTASIAAIQEGVFSVLLDGKSCTARVLKRNGELEVWAGGRRYAIEISDMRDRPSSGTKQSVAGPLELRALMPGKVVKLLVKAGMNVEGGQSLIVVEAMKMQNEMKSPKDGVVTKLYVSEGSTVAAGEPLIRVE